MKAAHWVLAALLLATPAHAATITHEDSTFAVSRGDGNAVVGLLTVSSTQAISSFGVDIDLNVDSNVKFVIFNSDTGAILYQSASKAFVDNGRSYKFSDPFSFTFHPGTTYGLTALIEMGGLVWLDTTANTIGAYHFLNSNQNTVGTYSSFALVLNRFCCDLGTALVTAPIVPVPAALPLFASGLGVLAWAARRKRTIAAV